MIDLLTSGVLKVLGEVRKLAGTLKQRANDILAYFDTPAAVTGSQERPTVASNTFKARQWGSGSSPATPPAHCSWLADSDPTYTLHDDEPE